tara:strand:+ start:558 stop:743 length:186 start_codon:yes stop_codon:yes gene_type:complete
MEAVIIILFGVICFISGVYTSSNFDKWLDRKIEPYTEEKKESEIKELSEKIDKFIKQLTGE